VLGTLAPRQAGMGNALSRALQSVGVALGTAILGSVLNSAYRGTLDGHLAGLPPAARTAASASIAGARAIAARQPGPAGQLLTQAADTAYAHGITRATAVGAGLLVICAILCAALLPGKRANTAPESAPKAGDNSAPVA
jgi:DHA2 family multidrug resistance protein-like MFS transporter